MNEEQFKLACRVVFPACKFRTVFHFQEDKDAIEMQAKASSIIARYFNHDAFVWEPDDAYAAYPFIEDIDQLISKLILVKENT